MKPKKIIDKVPAAVLDLSEEQRHRFAGDLNTSLLLAHLTDEYFIRAETTLKEVGNWELDLRTNWKHALNKIRKVTLYTDSTLEKDEEMFYADLKFLSAVMSVIKERAVDEEKQDKVLNMLKCMNL